MDGNGYPDGLKGPKIPVLARIISVVDCYDALTSSRAYREKLSPAQAREVLRSESGKQFEPEFVKAFLEINSQALVSDYV